MEVSLEKRIAMRARPERSAFMHQNWRDILFMSWEYDKDAIQKTLPKGIFVDTFEGKAYVTIVPFLIEGHKLGISVKGLTDFLEVNVRTYVYDEAGNPGVWFYSLDFSSRVGTFIARNFFYLPYFYTELECKRGDEIYLKGCRDGKVHMNCGYKKIGNSFQAEPGSLDFFIAERYALFTCNGRRLCRGQIYHRPYELYKAHVEYQMDDLFITNGLNVPDHNPDHIVFTEGVDVDFYRFHTIYK